MASRTSSRTHHNAPSPPGPPTYALTQTDAESALASLPPESVDLIITDPPYESLEKHRKIGTTTRLKHSKSSSNDWFPVFANDRFPAFFAAAWRVLRRNSHLYLFCDAETMFVVKPMAEAAGFRFWKPLVWDKQRIGMGYHYRARYEFVLFFEKGKRKLNDLGVPDILAAPRIWKGYPTEKPAAVSSILVTQSTVPGELVLDPFCGSGSVGVAALENGRNFLGADVGDAAMALTRERLQACGGREVEWPTELRLPLG